MQTFYCGSQTGPSSPEAAANEYTEKAVKVGWCLRICGMDHDIAGTELPDRYMQRRAYNVIDLARRLTRVGDSHK